VTLTVAEPEERVAVAADADDPVSALKGAQRDGLLHYHGSMTGGRYEVEVAGQHRELARADVADVVARLRAVATVGAARLVEVREDGTHVLRFGDRVEQLPADRVVDWCAGYVAARDGLGQDHVRAFVREATEADRGNDELPVTGWIPCGSDEPGAMDRITLIRDLFEQSGRDDQCRMVILGLMHGKPRKPEWPTSTQELADVVGKAKKTVVGALSFGDYLGSELADRMIAAFGLRWSVSAGGAACVSAEGDAEPVDLPEMPGLARLRRIVEAERRGWLGYLDDPSPNQARWNRHYRLSVGSQTYEVVAAALDAWLDGMKALFTMSQAA